jgi:hypothetical protein
MKHLRWDAGEFAEFSLAASYVWNHKPDFLSSVWQRIVQVSAHAVFLTSETVHRSLK